jgi:hypothetical protein
VARASFACVTDEFRAAAFPGKAFADVPRTADVTLQTLADPDVKKRIEGLNLRYLVVLDVRTTDTATQTNVEADKNFYLVWGVTRHWWRNSWLTATILDTRLVRKAGTLNCAVSGEAGWIFSAFLMIPMPPVPYTTATESKACDALGLATADFLGGQN